MRVLALFSLTLHDGHESGEKTNAFGTLSSGGSLSVPAGHNARNQIRQESGRLLLIFYKIIQ